MKLEVFSRIRGPCRRCMRGAASRGARAGCAFLADASFFSDFVGAPSGRRRPTGRAAWPDIPGSRASSRGRSPRTARSETNWNVIRWSSGTSSRMRSRTAAGVALDSTKPSLESTRGSPPSTTTSGLRAAWSVSIAGQANDRSASHREEPRPLAADVLAGRLGAAVDEEVQIDPVETVVDHREKLEELLRFLEAARACRPARRSSRRSRAGS